MLKYSKVDANDFEDIDKAVTLVKDQLDLLSRLFNQLPYSSLFRWITPAATGMSESSPEFVQMTDELEKRFMNGTKTYTLPTTYAAPARK